MVPESFAPIILLGWRKRVDLAPHGAIEEKNPLVEGILKQGRRTAKSHDVVASLVSLPAKHAN
jgi:hypothetical protein